VRAAPPPPPPLSIQAAADGLCLTTGPLRFTACAGADLWAAESYGSVLRLQSGPVTLWQPLSAEDEGPNRLCVDQRCIRCVHRGNGNRGKTGFCFKGHEEVHAGALSSAHAVAAMSSSTLACLVLAALFIGSRLLRGKGSTQPSRRAPPTAEGSTAAALQAAQDQSRQLRLHLRSSRDEARPVRLLHVMLAGEKFAELDEDGRAHNVWLEISPDQLRLRAFKTKTASEASESPLYELELSALRKISFGQSAHPAARSMQQKSSFPRFAPSQYTQTPWRCFAVDAGSAVPDANGVQERGDHFFVGQHDNSAITWVQGLQSLLHASGQLEQPLPPAKLLWLRARMRLLQRAVRHKSHASATLAAVVQTAVKKSATTRRG